ncbi:hypothetical protein VDGL01_01816 [Verticillium dahliae]
MSQRTNGSASASASTTKHEHEHDHCSNSFPPSQIPNVHHHGLTSTLLHSASTRTSVSPNFDTPSFRQPRLNPRSNRCLESNPSTVQPSYPLALVSRLRSFQLTRISIFKKEDPDYPPSVSSAVLITSAHLSIRTPDHAITCSSQAPRHLPSLTTLSRRPETLHRVLA